MNNKFAFYSVTCIHWMVHKYSDGNLCDVWSTWLLCASQGGDDVCQYNVHLPRKIRMVSSLCLGHLCLLYGVWRWDEYIVARAVNRTINQGDDKEINVVVIQKYTRKKEIGRFLVKFYKANSRKYRRVFQVKSRVKTRQAWKIWSQ